MTAVASALSDVGSFKRRVDVYPAAKQRRQHLSNLWFFDSPKINRRFPISGDATFMHIVLLEGDAAVIGYNATPTPHQIHVDGELREIRVDVHVFFNDSRVEWWAIKRANNDGPSNTATVRQQLSAAVQAAESAGAQYRIKTDAELKNQEIRFENWLNLCACINRCRNLSLHAETQVLHDRLNLHQSVVVETLLEAPGVDPALMLAAIAKALQGGAVFTELNRTLFGTNSILSRRER